MEEVLLSVVRKNEQGSARVVNLLAGPLQPDQSFAAPQLGAVKNHLRVLANRSGLFPDTSDLRQMLSGEVGG